MTKNQKIAAGCGGLGCLGLVVLALAGAAGYYYYYIRPHPERYYTNNRNSTTNFNSNSNANSDSNSSSNSNSNSADNLNANESTNKSSANSADENSSSYTDDDKHKLFQAASMTRDAEVVTKVVKKLGLFKANGTPADDYPQFIKDHIVWGASNGDFIRSLDTPEKARAFVDAHL